MDRIDTYTWEKARLLIGDDPNRPSAEIGTAINCAWDMGYRKPENIAAMARQLLAIPQR